MVRKKIIWSDNAWGELSQTLTYFNDRNGNSRYSQKLFKEIQKLLVIISKHPFLGKTTDIEDVRVVIFKDYQLFFKISDNRIIILTFWDSRSNPDDLRF